MGAACRALSKAAVKNPFFFCNYFQNSSPSQIGIWDGENAKKYLINKPVNNDMMLPSYVGAIILTVFYYSDFMISITIPFHAIFKPSVPY